MFMQMLNHIFTQCRSQSLSNTSTFSLNIVKAEPQKNKTSSSWCFHFRLTTTTSSLLLTVTLSCSPNFTSESSATERESLARNSSPADRRRKKTHLRWKLMCRLKSWSSRKNFFRYKIRCWHQSEHQFRFHFRRETPAWDYTLDF